MNIKIRTDKNRYFTQLLTLLGGIPPFSSLTKREIQVLGLMLTTFYNQTNKTKDERFEYVFSQENKEFIRIELDISKFNLNEIMTRLRKKHFISYGFIYDKYLLVPQGELTFKFIK